MQLDYQPHYAERLRLQFAGSDTSVFGLDAGQSKLKLTFFDQSPGAKTQIEPANPPSLQERVFNALADAKIWTSKVAMYMDLRTRDRYFRQLDLLHDCDEWLDGSPVKLQSYQGFVSLMHLLGGHSKPSLGLTPSGNLVAVWQAGEDRLTIEFIDRQHAQWVVSRRQDEEMERIAGSTTITRVKANLAPYNPAAWFGID